MRRKVSYDATEVSSKHTQCRPNHEKACLTEILEKSVAWYIYYTKALKSRRRQSCQDSTPPDDTGVRRSQASAAVNDQGGIQRECCLLVLNSVTSTLQWICRVPKSSPPKTFVSASNSSPNAHLNTQNIDNGAAEGGGGGARDLQR